MEKSNSGFGKNRVSMTQHTETDINSAPYLLREAANTIEQRAAERDLEHERSMCRAVKAFNTLTGLQLSETEGWLFMSILKLARATTGQTQPDDLHDCAAYVALALECVLKDEPENKIPVFGKPLTPEEIEKISRASVKPGQWVVTE